MANSVTSVSGNPISAQSRDRIIAYWVQGGSDFGFGPTIVHTIDHAQAQASVNDVAPWLPLGLTGAQKQARTQQWALLLGSGGQPRIFLKPWLYSPPVKT